jgi:hypothetical protein
VIPLINSNRNIKWKSYLFIYLLFIFTSPGRTEESHKPCSELSSCFLHVLKCKSVLATEYSAICYHYQGLNAEGDGDVHGK